MIIDGLTGSDPGLTALARWPLWFWSDGRWSLEDLEPAGRLLGSMTNTFIRNFEVCGK